jgi:transcriptional regulator with GAF, ATPase, and Fis domain
MTFRTIYVQRRRVEAAAEVLGLKPTTLESRMKKLGITRQAP